MTVRSRQASERGVRPNVRTVRGVRRAGAVCTTATAVLMLAACSSGPLPLLDVRTPQPPAQPADARCPRDGVGLGAEGVDRGPVPTPGALPADFEPTTVRWCRLSGDAVSVPDGSRHTVTEQTSTAAAALLEVLTLPDQELDPRDHAACAAIYRPPVYLLLVDREQHAFRPHLPAAPCHEPRPEVLSALLALRPTSSTTYTFDLPTT